jgi:hypothetical protein
LSITFAKYISISLIIVNHFFEIYWLIIGRILVNFNGHEIGAIATGDIAILVALNSPQP